MARLVTLSLSMAFALTACGGAVDSDLFGNGNDSGTPPQDSSVVDTGVRFDGGDPPFDGSIGFDATPIVDATPIFDVTPIDASPGDPGTLCQTGQVSTFCKNDTELCCIRQQGNACLAANQASTCTNGVRMFCDNTDSCKTGEVCCGNIQTNGQFNFYTEVKCAATCNVTAAQVPGQRRFCNPKSQPDECQQYGMTCKQSGILPAYFVCGN